MPDNNRLQHNNKAVSELAKKRRRIMLTQLECELEEATFTLSTMPHHEEYRGGCLVVKMVKCGKDGCRCKNGALHGPYTYYQYRDTHGKLHQKYLSRKEADKVVDAVRENAAYKKELSRIRNLKKQIAQLRREVEADGQA